MDGVNWCLMLLNPLLSRQGLTCSGLIPLYRERPYFIWQRKVAPRENLLPSFGYMSRTGVFYLLMNGGWGNEDFGYGVNCRKGD